MDRSTYGFRFAWLGLLAGLLGVGLSAGTAWAQPADESPDDSSGKQGFIFLDGQYLPAPYEVELTEDTLMINGREFQADAFDLSEYKGWEPDRDSRFGRRRPRWARESRETPGDSQVLRVNYSEGSRRFRETPETSSADRLRRFFQDVQTVRFGMILVLDSGEKPLLLYPGQGGMDLIRALRASDGTAAANQISSQLAGGNATWDRLLTEFQPTAEFNARADAKLERFDRAGVDAERVTAATQWISKISYPLTVFAMAVVVLGFGHLLSNRPKIESSGGDPTDWSNHRKVVGQSLLIVALLSVVDLIWTLGTADSGVMRELNPLGSGMIAEPVRLFLFKATVTGVSIAILYRLHRRPIAQVASWWCCLLLTLLTARWVMFQSMFL
ncbi:hypothetical protein Enr13x_28980 [Stieleria neptunia]|uniref:DUF5658 domain-containing protein n=1 Tax=Stieleria neptunia TaxID=2527979 RepID=A0A518HQB5_9BACT|nr:DUF5658 family protein [Stieleria neptunia]QDV43046.1 hypothetical protein Enr13x_28980 [Stieleria neptunia]